MTTERQTIIPVPTPGETLVPERWAEEVAVVWLAEQDDPAVLNHSQAQLTGLEAAYRALGVNTFELTKARRYLEVRWGEVLGPAEHGGDRRSDQVDRDPLDPLTPDDRKVFRRLAAHKDEVRDIIAEATDAEQVTRNAILRALNGAHVGYNSGDNEWYTPAPYIEAARVVMGGIDLDPASTAEANALIGTTTFYTEAENGLTKPWTGRVWMNPPYQRPLIDHFCARLAETYAQGDVTAACVLVNNATETGWFHALVEVTAAICFPRHRVKFWSPGKKEATPLQGQAVIYLGERLQLFRDTFVRFGFTVVL